MEGRREVAEGAFWTFVFSFAVTAGVLLAWRLFR
jgi:hypothetical protein